MQTEFDVNRAQKDLVANFMEYLTLRLWDSTITELGYELKTSLIRGGRLFQSAFTLPGRAFDSQSKNPVVLHSPLRTPHAERNGTFEWREKRRERQKLQIIL